MMKKVMSMILVLIICLISCSNMAFAEMPSGTEYVNEEYGYKIIFPESWDGYIFIKEYEGTPGVGICFEGKSNISKENPYKDYPLFSVQSQEEVDAERDIIDSVEKVGAVRGVNYYHTTGTGIAPCFMYLHEKVYSNEIATDDFILAQEDLKQQQKIMSEATQVRVVEINKVSEQNVNVEETIFQAPVYTEVMGEFCFITEFDNCEYKVGNDRILNRYDLLDGKNQVIANDVVSFITDNKIVYYNSTEKQGIYKLDVASGVEERVFNGKVDSIDGCWNNRYLYYYEYEGGYPNCNTWVLDLLTGETWIMFSETCISSLYTCGNKIYYTLYLGDMSSSDLYTCDVDGSNKKKMGLNVCGFGIFDSKIYYAECDYDYGSGLLDFHVMKCDLDGNNSIAVSECFKKETLHSLKKDGVVLRRDENYIKIPYTLPDEIIVTVDGNKVEFDQSPIIVKDRTLVPVRAIFEVLGATIEWDDATQTVIARKENTTITMTIGKNEMYKNDEKIVLDIAPQLVGERTLVPVRAVAESFDCNVEWNEESQNVIITSK